jgi:hypothetical protein
MLQTTNYSLNKPEATDVVDISKLNDNFDTIDTQLKSVSDKANYIQTAGGTATAITLSNVTLSNGFTVTFVAAYNNSGSATAINGKALYKAGTTAAPTLIAGKAYTVWYNGTNFFIKASAEGTATAGDVLAGKTFSSDTDTGLSGTMTDNGAVSQSLGINGTYTIPAGYHNGSGKITQSVTTKTAATYSPSTSAQTISAGQYLSGDQTIAATTGTAAAAEVLSGKTFNSANGIGLAGTMTNNGAVSQSLGINGSYTIPAGYHNGSGKVTQSVTTKAAATYTPGTTDQTIAAGQYLSGTQTIAGDADLVSENIKSGVNIFGVAGSSAVVDTTEATNPIAAASVLSGKIGYVNGSKVTGTIASKTAATYNPSTSDQTIVAGQYLSGAQTVKGDANLLTNNIKSGVSIFGVSGKASVIDTSDASAAASQILSGSTAYVNGSKITGTMVDRGAVTITPSTSDQAIPAGYHNGSGYVAAGNPLITGQGSVSAICNEDITAGDMVSVRRYYSFDSPSALAALTAPSFGANTVSFTPDGIYLAVASRNGSSNMIAVYKRSGDTFTVLSALPSQPDASCAGVSFSPDGIYLAAAYVGIYYLMVWKRNGDTFTLLYTNSTVTDTSSDHDAVSWSRDGIYIAMARGSEGARVALFKRTNDSITQIVDPPTAADETYSLQFSKYNDYLACIGHVSPYVTIYSYSGDTFTKLANPTTLPTNQSHGLAFCKGYLAVFHNTTPFVTIYKQSENAFTKLANPSILPSGLCKGGAFSPDGMYLLILSNYSPYAILYKRAGDTFTKLANPTTLTQSTSYQFAGAAFTEDGLYYAITSPATSPYLAVYKASTTSFYDVINKYLRTDIEDSKLLSSGFASSTGVTGATLNITTLPI